jgi:DNA-directed RNA polymerase subunit RPC12/RpoP
MDGMEPARTPPQRDDDDSLVSCPWCGSTRVERLGEFGPGLMTAQYFCLDCRSPFEWIKR